jgi:putative CocE/NonD family hydrolase
MIAVLLLLASLPWNAAQDSSRSWEQMVQCRDGVDLHTRIVLPRNYTDKKFTAIVDRSPYGYTDLEWMADLYLPHDFVTVGQDFRGTKKSDGYFTIWHRDANDSEDLGDWIVQQPWSNGKIFTFGASADGLGAFTTVQNEPKWLAAQFFIWATSISYEIFYPGGTMQYHLINEWIHHTVEGEWADVCYEDIKKNEMKNGKKTHRGVRDVKH